MSSLIKPIKTLLAHKKQSQYLNTLVKTASFIQKASNLQ